MEMVMNWKRGLRAGCIAAGVLGVSLIAHAAGLWSTLPGLGQAAYCASTVTGTGGLSGITGQGQGTTGAICGQTVPAGPPVFAGTEYFPVDIGPLGANVQAGGASTVVVTLLQLGVGPMIDLTTVATTQTIPNATPYYFLDGTQASAFTVTMPSSPLEGQLQRVVCESATVGALTIAANTGQTVKNSPGTACVAGTAYVYRYQASSLTWFKS